MRIVGDNFSACLSIKDGVVAGADRPIRWAVGKPLARILALAKRWHWKVEFNDTERRHEEAQRDSAQRPTA
jgi:hypothetical protein